MASQVDTVDEDGNSLTSRDQMSSRSLPPDMRPHGSLLISATHLSLLISYMKRVDKILYYLAYYAGHPALTDGSPVMDTPRHSSCQVKGSGRVIRPSLHLSPLGRGKQGRYNSSWAVSLHSF
jgi:hypothetical protein